MNQNKGQMLTLFLVAVICILAGLLLGKSSTPSPSAYQMPADDGKLAKSYKEENLVKAIRDNAKILQTCYLAYLDKKPEIKEGVMNILLKVEESGQISEVKITKDQFQNLDFENCLIKKIEKFYLSPPPLGINRYLAHELGFKSEETALKEAKERQEKNRPPKVLPVR
ncbi:MAG: hypothetical protein KBD76_13590 [Bacteriovorax sp.]|nr:hypothetical protein [Bacteriovorax sp.]